MIQFGDFGDALKILTHRGRGVKLTLSGAEVDPHRAAKLNQRLVLPPDSSLRSAVCRSRESVA
jgi:hypothetical protein